MIVPLTPIRFLYRGVDLFGKKDRSGVGGQAVHLCAVRRALRTAGHRACARMGIQPGDRVAYLSFNTHQLLEGYYGVVMAGAIVMPLNVRLTPAELIGILNHSGARDADF